MDERRAEEEQAEFCYDSGTDEFAERDDGNDDEAQQELICYKT